MSDEKEIRFASIGSFIRKQDEEKISLKKSHYGKPRERRKVVENDNLITELDEIFEQNVKTDKKEEQLDFDKPSYKNQFFAMNQLLSAAIFHDLTKRDLKVLHELICHQHYCFFGNNIIFEINQKLLSQELKSDPGNVSKSLKKLIKAEVLEKTKDKKYRFLMADSFTDEPIPF